MTKKKCCSIILNYNSYEDTKKLTINFKKNDDINKIVIVDNNSLDNSFAELKKDFKDFKDVFIIKTDENLGYSYGNNFGAKYILNNFNVEYILISNPDVIIPNNFVKNMEKYLESDPKLAAVSGLMLNYKKELIHSQIAWKIPTLLNYTLMNLNILNTFHNPIEYSFFDFNGNNTGLTHVECLPGSCFVIRSDILKEIGFFDDNIFLYCEEVILGKKIKDLSLSNGLSFNDFFIHNHNKSRSYKEEVKNDLILYKSRFYYITHYTQFGYIFSPFFLFTMIIGLFEKNIILIFNKLIRGKI